MIYNKIQTLKGSLECHFGPKQTFCLKIVFLDLKESSKTAIMSNLRKKRKQKKRKIIVTIVERCFDNKIEGLVRANT